MFKAKTQHRANILTIMHQHLVKDRHNRKYFADARKRDDRSNIDGWSMKFYMGRVDDMKALNKKLKPHNVVADYTTSSSIHYGGGMTSVQVFRRA